MERAEEEGRGRGPSGEVCVWNSAQFWVSPSTPPGQAALTPCCHRSVPHVPALPSYRHLSWCWQINRGAEKAVSWGPRPGPEELG